MEDQTSEATMPSNNLGEIWFYKWLSVEEAAHKEGTESAPVDHNQISSIGSSGSSNSVETDGAVSMSYLPQENLREHCQEEALVVGSGELDNSTNASDMSSLKKARTESTDTKAASDSAASEYPVESRSAKRRRLLTEQKRLERNSREKERSNIVSNQFNELKNLLSQAAIVIPKGTKNAVLSIAIDYIRALQEQEKLAVMYVDVSHCNLQCYATLSLTVI
jgi:Helix-loop-helix DNA-binding domain